MNALLVKSLNLGIIDTALNWLISAITTLLMWIVEWTLDLLITIFAEILYGIGLTLLDFVDFFQAFFNALCGMGTYWDASGTPFVKQDPIISLVTNETVLQTFLALTAVAVIMLFLTTLIAIIRTEFTTEGAKNTKGNIIGSAIKSFAMFIVVPAACVLGIQISCALLNAVYNATTGGDSVSAGAMVWYAASYNANKLRTGQIDIPELADKEYLKDFGISNTANKEDAALIIDNVFKSSRYIITQEDLKELVDKADLGLMDKVNGTADNKFEPYYTYRSLELTKEFYNIRDMNFLVLFMGGGIAIYIMFIAAFGLIIRMYKCAILFMISAPISALTPLDGGNAYKSWRKLMIGAVCSAFAIVIAFNLVFLLIPIMSEINIFNPDNYILNSWNRLVNTIFVLTGLYSIKETSKWVASMLGIEDPLAAGSEISGKVMGTIGKMGTAAGGLALSAAGKTMAKVASAKANRDSRALSEAMEGKVEKNEDGTLKTNEDGSYVYSQNVDIKTQERIEKQRKALEKTDGRAKKAASFASKAQKTGTGIIAKSMGQKFQKLDDFMGGAKILGGYDDEGNAVGLGGLATKAATGLYSGASTVTGALVGSAAYGAFGGDDATIGDLFANPDKTSKKAPPEYKYTKKNGHYYRQKLAKDGKSPYVDPNTGKAVGPEEITKYKYKEAAGFGKKMGAAVGAVGGVGRGFFGGANGVSQGGNILAGIIESEAHMKKVSDMMKQAGKELASLMEKMTKSLAGLGSKAFNAKTGNLTAATREMLAPDLLKIRELSGSNLTVDELAAGLAGRDKSGMSGSDFKKDIQTKFNTNQNKFGEFYNANINMGGIKVEMMSTDLKETLQSVFSGLGVEGADFSTQFEEIKANIKQEFEKQRAEAEKDRKQIAALAVAIAKYGKRLNPGK